MVSRGRRIGSVVASLVASAGAGALILGRVRRGVVLIAAELACAWAGVMAILGGRAWGHALFAAVLLVRLGASIDVARLAPGERLPPAGAAWGMAIGLWALAFADAALTRAFAVEAFVVPSASMVPTIAYGDRLFVDKRAGVAARGDVVAFRTPRDRRQIFVKRVIAVGGERVELRGGAVFVDGRELAARRLDEPCSYDDRDEVSGESSTRPCVAFEESLGERRWRVIRDERAGAAPDVPSVVVPAGAVYVLGDNRDNSLDSRHFGPVGAGDVVGQAIGIYGGIGRAISAIRPVR